MIKYKIFIIIKTIKLYYYINYILYLNIIKKYMHIFITFNYILQYVCVLIVINILYK